MIFDLPYLIVLGLGALLSGWAAMRVRSTFARFDQVGTRLGATGAEVAQRILERSGIRDVTIEPVAGRLTDHYDPRSKALRLSEPVFRGRSVSALGVAAHEVGHAIQHARDYAPLKFRSAWVPVAGLGGKLSMLILFLALMLGGAATAMGETVAFVGVALFATTTVFTLVTLPVEFDASRRALACLADDRLLDADELQGARRVLNAAAMTYVAAFAMSLLQLLFWAWRLGLLGGRRSDA